MHSAEVLEPIYQDLAEWRKLIGVLEVKLGHTEDAWQKVEILHQIAGLLESDLHLDSPKEAFDVYARALAVDPNNNFCWRFDRQRMSAEELRDSLLAASQQLDLSPGGPHPIPPTSTWSFSQHVPFAGVPETNKRSIYLMTLRNRRHPFMGLFDGADPNATTPLRQVTTVPTQSLYFMNDEFFHSQAEKVAMRILHQPDDAARLNALFRIVFQRSPTAGEQESATAFLASYLSAITDIPETDQSLAAWSALSRVLLSSNEFVYLD